MAGPGPDLLQGIVGGDKATLESLTSFTKSSIVNTPAAPFVNVLIGDTSKFGGATGVFNIDAAFKGASGNIPGFNLDIGKQGKGSGGATSQQMTQRAGPSK